MREKLDALGRRYPWFGRVLAVQNRYSELNGNYLAGAVTLAGFLSIFPLLLISFAVLGHFAAGRVDLAGDIINKLGLSGEAEKFLRDLIEQTERSRRIASLVGVAGLLWSGLGLVAAVQYALNTVWQVKGRGWRDKVSGLGWLVGAGVLFMVSFAMTAGIKMLPGAFAPLGFVTASAIDVVLWLWTMRVLTNRRLSWRAFLPGAVVGTVGLGVLKAVGSLFVPQLVSHADALYGSLGVVFAILAWLLFFGRLVVYAAVVNVVEWEGGHGTVTVDLEVPKVPGEVPLEATRAGEGIPREPAAAPTPAASS